MKKKLFGSLGETIKGNAVLIILSVCVLVAGGLSYYTVNDINNKLKNQQVKNPPQTQNPSPTEEPAQDVQNEANNVPLKPTATPSATAKPDKTNSDSSSASEQTSSQQEEVVAESGFIMPVEGEIYNAFSRDELVYNKSMDDWRTHNGVDIKTSKDSAVKAGASGVVTKVYQDGMLGHTVEIQTDNYTAKYCGLNSKIMVKKGDSVKQGQTIGTVGEVSLEIAEEAHLHLEILENGKQVDPSGYLK